MKTVKIAELKAHLSEHLRAVESGDVVTVLDRSRPIARLVPIRDEVPAVDHLAPRASIRDFVPPAAPLLPGVDAVELLLQDRARR